MKKIKFLLYLLFLIHPIYSLAETTIKQPSFSPLFIWVVGFVTIMAFCCVLNQLVFYIARLIAYLRGYEFDIQKEQINYNLKEKRAFFYVSILMIVIGFILLTHSYFI